MAAFHEFVIAAVRDEWRNRKEDRQQAPLLREKQSVGRLIKEHSSGGEKNLALARLQAVRRDRKLNTC